MKRPLLIILLLVAAVLVMGIAPLVGPTMIPASAAWGDVDDDLLTGILWRMRVPRVAMAFLAGAGLALGGMAFQALFRNPLATPFTLGVASGASLGAAIGIQFRWTVPLLTGLGISATSLWAFGGACASILIVYSLTLTKKRFSAATMLLAGVTVSFFFSSVILFMQYITDPSRTVRMIRWTMGGLSNVSWTDAVGAAPFVVAATLIILCLTRELDLLTVGEELAISCGVEVDRVKKWIFFAVSMMVAGVVTVAGPVAFVGLIVPHACRLIIGPGHRWLAPASLLGGGIFLVLCDTAARSVLSTIESPAELPVGIITALLGGPFFLWLLLTDKAEV